MFPLRELPDRSAGYSRYRLKAYRGLDCLWRSSQGRRVCRRTTIVIVYSQILRSNRSARGGAVSFTGVKHELSSVMIAFRARSIGLLKDILIDYLRSVDRDPPPIFSISNLCRSNITARNPSVPTFVIQASRFRNLGYRQIKYQSYLPISTSAIPANCSHLTAKNSKSHVISVSNQKNSSPN